MSEKRRPSLTDMLKAAKAAGLSVVGVESIPTGWKLLTADAPAEPMDDLDRARLERRARKAAGNAYGH